MKHGLGRLIGTAAAHTTGYLAVLGWNAVAARRVEVEVYGAFSLALTIALLAQVFLGCGMPQSMVRFGSGASGSWAGRLSRWGYGVPTALAALGIGIAFLAGRAGDPGSPTSWSLPWLVACGYALAILSVAAAIHQSRGRPAFGTWFGIALTPLGVLAAFLVLAGPETDADSLLRIYAITALAVAAAAVVSTASGRISGAGTERVGFRAFLGFGVTALGMGLVYMVLSYVDRIMLGSLSDMYEVGIYSIPSRLVRMLYFVLYLFPPLVAPIFARHLQSEHPETALSVYFSSSRVILMVSAPLMLILVLEPELAVTLLGGEQYLAGMPALRILAVGAFIAAGVGNQSEMLQMGGRERAVLVFSAVALVINLVLNALLIPAYGATGAAWGTAVGLVAATTGKSVLCRRRWGCLPPLIAERRVPAVLAAVVVLHTLLDSAGGWMGVAVVGSGSVLLVLVLRPRATLRTLVESVAKEGA